MSQWSRSFDSLIIEDEGNLVLLNIRNNLPSSRVSHLRKLEFSEALLREPQILTSFNVSILRPLYFYAC